jgi:hypothetical protein
LDLVADPLSHFLNERLAEAASFSLSACVVARALSRRDEVCGVRNATAIIATTAQAAHRRFELKIVLSGGSSEDDRHDSPFDQN